MTAGLIGFVLLGLWFGLAIIVAGEEAETDRWQLFLLTEQLRARGMDVRRAAAAFAVLAGHSRRRGRVDRRARTDTGTRRKDHPMTTYDPTDHDRPRVHCDGQLDLMPDGDEPIAMGDPDPTTITPHFDGETYDPTLDHVRLSRQLDRVLSALFMARRAGDSAAHTLGTDPEDYGWRTLAQLAAEVGAPEASISARLRDLRKPRFGGFDVDRRRAYPDVESGLWEYRLAGDLRDAGVHLRASAGPRG